METDYNKSKFGKSDRKRKGKHLECETCKKVFYVYPERIKRGMVKYCSQKCYKKDGSNNPFWGQKHSYKSIAKMVENPNRHRFKEGGLNYNHIRFNESFRGKSFAWWRRYLKRDIDKCELCGFDKKEILEVHHKDRDRSNNTKENLIMICPNCHCWEHYKTKTGRYNLKNRRNGKK